MLPLLIPGLISLVPVIIKQFEKSNPTATNAQKHEWVHGFFQDLGALVEKQAGHQYAPIIDEMEELLTSLIQSELDKLIPV